ncbi:MAG: PilZ domain-containing protein [Candidatus Polarisedimenticolaceae bacterium]|nr:PilZ domain-containing protein [Candidatus Polarisedimenticolaceae bacterium]
MSDKNSEWLTDERRSYFRIDDVVKLGYRVVSSEELPELIERLESGAGSNFTVMSSFTAMSQQMVVQLRRIEGTAPDTAACIKILDQKLNILGRAFLVQEEEAANQATKAVNISAGGIVFSSAEPYEKGEALELKLLLMPEMTGMMIYGEVVECVENEGGESREEPYCLRINFSNIREADRDILIRYLLRSQGKWLQKRRQESEDSDAES